MAESFLAGGDLSGCDVILGSGDVLVDGDLLGGRDISAS